MYKPVSPHLQFHSSQYKRLDDRYLLTDELLGKGQYGKVYSAEDTTNNTSVAIKLLHNVSESKSRQLLNRHKLIMDSINSANLLKIFDIAVPPAIIVERLYGWNLSEIFCNVTASFSQICLIMHQTACGLSSLHDTGFIHRDIKPSNLFYVKRGFDRGRIKIIDFDTCIPIEDLDLIRIEQKTEGTLAFISPEQLRNDPNFSSDIYSLGLSILSILIGYDDFSKKFCLESESEIIKNRLKPDFIRLKDISSFDLPKELISFLELCISYDPQNRPTAKEMIYFIENLSESYCDEFLVSNLKLRGVEKSFSSEAIALKV